MPVVIRPFREGYQILGEAYIQGMMDGEILELMRQEHLMFQPITLY